ncbi:hypothetical protein ACIP9X_05555 [Arthrobacter sp. NPDC093125]
MHKLIDSTGMQETVRFIFHFLLIFSLVVIPPYAVEAITSLMGLS